MIEPRRIRAYARVVVRDILIPGAGLFLVVYLPLTGALEPFFVPLIAAMLGTPLVARKEES